MENNSIAILGGSFDPPGIHHMMMVSELLNLREVERVIIVPCGIREDKKLTASGSQRLEMLRLSVEEVLDNDPRVSVRPSLTVDR